MDIPQISPSSPKRPQTTDSSPSIPKRFQALVSSASQLPSIPFLNIKSSGSIPRSNAKSISNINDSLLLIDPKLGANLYGKLFNLHKKTLNEDFYFQGHYQQENQVPLDILYCGKDNLFPRIFVINQNIILGQGSQGIVYLGQEIFNDKNVKDNLLVAVKVLKVNSPQRKEDCSNEMKLLSLQNRCRGYYYDNKKSLGYIIQDYCYGKSFFDWCYKKTTFNQQTQQYIYERIKMNPLQKKRFVTAILQAYHDLHQKYGILHRDIKPENIMIEVTNSDQIIVTIIDFATACLMQNTDKNFSGTPGYLPPETTCDISQRPYASMQTEYWSIAVMCAALLSEKNYLNFLNKKMATAQRKSGFIPDSTQKDLYKALPDIFNKKEPNVRLLRRNQNSTSSSSSYSSPSPTILWEDYLNQSLCWLAHPNVNLRPNYQDITRILGNLKLYEKNGLSLDIYEESILSERISSMFISQINEEDKRESKLTNQKNVIKMEEAGSTSSSEADEHDIKIKNNAMKKK